MKLLLSIKIRFPYFSFFISSHFYLCKNKAKRLANKFFEILNDESTAICFILDCFWDKIKISWHKFWKFQFLSHFINYCINFRQKSWETLRHSLLLLRLSANFPTSLSHFSLLILQYKRYRNVYCNACILVWILKSYGSV